MPGVSANTLERREGEHPPAALDRTSRPAPDETEHKKTPVCVITTLTGVISSEFGQAVFPFGEGKLHCLRIKYANPVGQTTKILRTIIFLLGRGFLLSA
jgi:hypothetical protein